MVERLNHSLALYQEYEPILSEYPRFQKALAVTYYNTLVFLNKARTVFTMSGEPTLILVFIFGSMAHGIFGVFDQDSSCWSDLRGVHLKPTLKISTRPSFITQLCLERKLP